MTKEMYHIDIHVEEERHDFLIARMDEFSLYAMKEEYNIAVDKYEFRFKVFNGVKDRVMDFLDDYGFMRWCTPTLEL